MTALNLPKLRELLQAWRSDPTGDPAVIEPIIDGASRLLAIALLWHGETRAT